MIRPKHIYLNDIMLCNEVSFKECEPIYTYLSRLNIKFPMYIKNKN